MRLSRSAELAWQIAAHEAAVADYASVEPDHYFVAVLKIAELDKRDMGPLATDEDAIRELSIAAQGIRSVLEPMNIDITSTRREVRRLLGKGSCKSDGGEMHRSKRSRELFQVAAEWQSRVDDTELTAVSLMQALLASPTDTMHKVLGTYSPPVCPSPDARNALGDLWRDLTSLAADGNLGQFTERPVESCAIIEVLTLAAPKSILLVCNSPQVRHDIMASVAKMMSSQQVPDRLKGMRLISVTATSKDQSRSCQSPSDLSDRILLEAIMAKNLVLAADTNVFLSSSGAAGIGDTQRAALQTLRCIVLATEQEYQEKIQRSRELRRLLHTMWVTEGAIQSLPDLL
jgi:ATP-dependent Clp protease ATP-binding subunit ClpA